MHTYPSDIAPFVTGLYPKDAHAYACKATNMFELAAH